LGIGDWGLGIGPNPQSPIPNPQSPFFNLIKNKIYNILILCNNFMMKYKTYNLILNKMNISENNEELLIMKYKKKTFYNLYLSS